MTSTIETHARHDAEAPTQADASGRMPRAVRLSLIVTLGALMTGAVYLLAVRGEALLVDLAALGGRLWCF
jgi:hypothetical protein